MGASLPPELARLLEAADPASREQAWDDFVAAYSRLLLHTARSVAHDHDAAMDAYTQVLEGLRADECRRLRAYQTVAHAKFTTWLVVVARRLCLDHRRIRYGRQPEAGADARPLRRRLADMLAEQLDVADVRASDEDAAAVIEADELRRLLEACSSALDPADRLLLKLRFEDDLPARAIAEVLGFASAFHVYRRLDKVTAALRDCLRRRGVTGPA